MKRVTRLVAWMLIAFLIAGNLQAPVFAAAADEGVPEQDVIEAEVLEEPAEGADGPEELLPEAETVSLRQRIRRLMTKQLTPVRTNLYRRQKRLIPKMRRLVLKAGYLMRRKIKPQRRMQLRKKMPFRNRKRALLNPMILYLPIRKKSMRICLKKPVRMFRKEQRL